MPRPSSSTDIQSINAILPAQYTLTSSERICSLWAGYGSISRLRVRSKQDDASNRDETLILKSIHPPTLTTRNTNDESHCRKLLSYNVERYFYHNLSEKLPRSSSGILTDCNVAEHTLLRLDDNNDDTTKNHKKNSTAETEQDPNAHHLLLSDLTTKFPIQPYHALTYPQTLAVIRWLATFHATFWNPESQPSSNPSQTSTIPFIPPPLQCTNPNNATGIWQQGGYWYLDTRRDEYNSMLDNEEEYSWLIPYAENVVQQIKNTKSQWKTLIHGDAKAANILFDKVGGKGKKRTKATLNMSASASTSNEEKDKQDDEESKIHCAMYDFQYVGQGLGVQDLVYFLGTSVESRVVAENMRLDHLYGGDKGSDNMTFLRYYHEQLCRAYKEQRTDTMKTLDGREEDGGVGYTYTVMLNHWELAVVDWQRFMAGWGCWGNSDWIEEMARDIVEEWDKNQ